MLHYVHVCKLINIIILTDNTIAIAVFRMQIEILMHLIQNDSLAIPVIRLHSFVCIVCFREQVKVHHHLIAKLIL